MSRSNVRIERLGPITAAQEADQIVSMMGLIGPHVGTDRYLLSSQAGDRQLYGKWEHSLVLREAGTPAGVLLAYERPGDVQQSRKPELHLGVLAVDDQKQGKGYGSLLIRQFVDEAIIRRDFVFLDGPIEHVGLSVADDKVGPRKLYEAFGFEIIDTENREEGITHIMQASLSSVIQTPKYQQTPVL